MPLYYEKPFLRREESTVKNGTIIILIIIAVLVTAGVVMSRNNRQAAPPSAAATANEPAATPDTSTAAAAEAIPWLTAYDKALAQAKSRNTLVVVDATADWCIWCKRMERDTFSKAEVQEKLGAFVPLKLDTDKEPQLAQRYKIEGLPTTLVLDATGKVLISQSGYMTPAQYLELLAGAEKMLPR